MQDQDKTKGGFNMVTHFLDFFYIFSGRKFENYINQLQSYIFWVQSPPRPSEKV